MVDICDMVLFRDALLSPRLKLNTLYDIDVEMESVHCTAHFAECRATLHGNPIMIYAPISIQASSLLHHANNLLRTTPEGEMTELQLLDKELLHPMHHDKGCMLCIERMKSDRILQEVLPFGKREQLLMALDELDGRLKRLDISINNLSASNLTIDNRGILYPIRQYYATSGYGADREALQRLREVTKELTPQCATSIDMVCDMASDYAIEPPRALIEGRRAIRCGATWGFADEHGEVVIAPRYGWVSDFSEGRAMVMTEKQQMGLIDKSGKQLIPTIYEVVEYERDSGNSWVRNNQQWALFDYCGTQITDWHDRDECLIEL